MLECVLNISEGRDLDLVARIAGQAGRALLDVHSDPHHHRSVLTVVGEEAARAVAAAAVADLRLEGHDGVHPRLGVLDVVPFVALDGSDRAEARSARDRFATWLAAEWAVPCFLYGPERTLPDIRRHAFTSLAPDVGPAAPHPTAGATAVGERPVLIAYNVWVSGLERPSLLEVAATVRGPGLRALGLEVGDRHQVSMNLVEPSLVGPAEAFDRVERATRDAGGTVEGAELVGLLPATTLHAIPRQRWAELDVDAGRTIEARLEAQGLP